MLQFAYPLFLWSLLLIAAPIIIHLFHFRRFKKVYFSNVSFLKNIQITTQNRRELKKWLILASRCLTLIFLVFAFAQPFIPDGTKQTAGKSHVVSVYIDNSFSMNAEGKEGNLLLAARQKAREIVKSFKESDKFQLLTNDFEGRHQHLTGRDEFLQWVDEIKPSPISRSISEVQNRQEQAMKPISGASKIAFVLSDFQSSTLHNYQKPTDSSILYTWVPFNAYQKKNIAIDSCWFETPYIKLNEVNKLVVRLKNYGNEAIDNGSVSLTINGSQKTVGGFSVGSNASAEASLSFKVSVAGWQECELAIVDNPITFDDKLFFSFKANENTNIYVVEGLAENQYIKNVYLTDSYFKPTFSSASQIDYSKLKSASLLILDGVNEYSSGFKEEVSSFLKKGGDVVLFPSTDEKSLKDLQGFLENYGVGMASNFVREPIACDQINLQSIIYKDAFENQKSDINLPEALTYIAYQTASKSNFEPLLTLKNGKPFLGLIRVAKGKLYICASPLNTDFSSFSRNAVFVPFMLKAALASSKIAPLFYRLNVDKLITLNTEIPKTEQGVKLTKGSFEMIPEIANRSGSSTLFLADAVKEAGSYALQTSTTEKPVLSFNYTPEESNITYAADDELESVAGKNISVSNEDKVAKVISDLDGSIRLWRYCLWLALLFIVVELALIKWMK